MSCDQNTGSSSKKPERVCNDQIVDQNCTDVTRDVPRIVCSDVPKEICDIGKRQDCQEVERTVCKMVPIERQIEECSEPK